MFKHGKTKIKIRFSLTRDCGLVINAIHRPWLLVSMRVSHGRDIIVVIGVAGMRMLSMLGWIYCHGCYLCIHCIFVAKLQMVSIRVRHEL